MKNKVLINGIEIEYTEDLINKIRESKDVDSSYNVSEEEVVQFFHESFKSAIEKGYGIMEQGE